MAKLDREVLKLQLRRLFLRYDWTKDNLHRYTDFFTECASIFDQQTRMELNNRIWAVEKKYFNWPLITLETLLYSLSHHLWGKKIYLKARLGARQPFTMSDVTSDLNNIVLWCKHQLHAIATQNEIDTLLVPAEYMGA